MPGAEPTDAEPTYGKPVGPTADAEPTGPTSHAEPSGAPLEPEGATAQADPPDPNPAPTASAPAAAAPGPGTTADGDRTPAGPPVGDDLASSTTQRLDRPGDDRGHEAPRPEPGDGPGHGEVAEEAEDDDVPGEDEEPRRRSNPLTREIKVDARVLIAIVAAVALAAGAYVLGQRQADKAAAPQGGNKTTSSTAFKVPADYTTFNDPATGVKLSVPKDWVPYSTVNLPDKALRLLTGIPNTGDSVSLRVNSYESEVTAANVGDQKAVFDSLLGDEKITILVNQTVSIGGLPALFYVYRFTDQASGQAGIHAHFFVFQGRKMVSMIFQALPEDRYKLLAPVFDKVASSLQVAPGPLPDFLKPATPSTTAAPATTAPGSQPTTATSSPASSDPATTAPTTTTP